MSTMISGVFEQAERWGELLESATHEVFGMMLGCDVQRAPQPQTCSADVTAVVGIAGPLNGALTIRCTCSAAVQMAAAMLGITVEEVGQQQHWDAIGEICNMVAGSFKAKLPGEGDRCMLSVPTIVNGRDYTVRSLVNGNPIYRAFNFQGELVLLCLEMHLRSQA